ncbi:MAG: hypothetical protein H6674_09335 [Dehalococcoidia bacterium]|nr:hypothetical protein [Dehalococcoidia bacterium]
MNSRNESKDAAFSRLHKEIYDLAGYAGRMADVFVQDGISTRGSSAFAKHQRQLEDQRFKIVFVAPFQSGKSTLFNAFAGGREVSPTGLGTRTSACAIEAHYVNGPAQEHALLEWRTDAELLGSFPSFIVDATDIQDRSRTRQAKPEKGASPDFGDEKFRKRLESAIQRVLKDGGGITRDDAERIQSCALILKHYDKAQAERDMHAVSIDVARKLISFPPDWGSEACDADEYALRDVLFLFLRRAQLYLHSNSLKRTRAVLVDCPGRGASAIDNALAAECVNGADAIILLLGTEGKTLDLNDHREIEWLTRDLQVDARRIFIAYNARESRQILCQRHVPVDLPQLRRLIDPNLDESNIYIVNALLALRAIQMATPLDELGHETISVLAERYRTRRATQHSGDDPELARKTIERDARAAYEMFTGGDWAELDQSNIHDLIDLSGWNGLVSAISQFVETREMREFLLRRGLDPIRTELELIQRELETHAQAPARSAADRREQRIRAREIMGNIESKLRRMATEVDRLFRNGGEAEHEIRKDLEGRLTKLCIRRILERKIRSMKYPRFIRAELRDELNSRMNTVVSGWLSGIQKGDSQVGSVLHIGVETWNSKAKAAFEAELATLPQSFQGTFFREGTIFWSDVEFEVYPFECNELDIHVPATTEVANKISRSWFGGVFNVFREAWALAREAFEGESMDYLSYIQQLPAVERSALEQIADYVRDVVFRVSERLRAEHKRAFETAWSSQQSDFDARDTQIEKETEADADSLVETARKAEVALGDLLRVMREDVELIQDELVRITGSHAARANEKSGGAAVNAQA